MNLNFPLLLVLATFVCGLVWLLDALFFARSRRRRREEAAALNGKNPGRVSHAVERSSGAQEPWPVEYARSFFPVLLIVLILRSFIFEPFRIPSGSMIPTLLVGDFILVNKFSYGIRLPVINTKILDTGSPNRGDVAVFRFPNNPQLDYIKRVVGLPGDKISYRNDKTLMINGEQVEITEGEQYQHPVSGLPLQGQMRGTENLLGIEHSILQMADRGVKEQSWEVPDGHYFMMGDNRDNSFDSRGWGFVPEENLVGKAFFIWMNLHDWSVIWSRIGDSIK